MKIGAGLLIAFVLPLFAFAGSRDHTVVLSGGVSPFQNHYSQYLQTKLLAEHMRTRLSMGQVDLFFAAGNNESTPWLFPDVHRYVTSSGLEYVDQLLPGVIPGNRPAEQEVLRDYFKTELPGKFDPNGNLFLIVTDHGEPNPALRELKNKEDAYSNNCINLWSGLPTIQDDGYEPEFDPSWIDKITCLPVRELKRNLDKTNPKRTVFAMTQCFSGGFHRMSVTRDRDSHWTADRRVCGFTASDEDTVAAGCTSDVNEETYRGYERFFAEALSGQDVITGETKGSPAKSFREAHYAAAWIDNTVDIPLSTSEYFLKKWAQDFRGRTFKPRTSTLSDGRVRKLFQQVLRNKISREEILQSAGPLSSWFEFQFLHLDRMGQTLAKSHTSLVDLVHTPVSEIESRVSQIRKSILSLKKVWSSLMSRTHGRINKASLDYLEFLRIKEKNPKYRSDPANRYHSFLAEQEPQYERELFHLTRTKDPEATILAEQKRKYFEIFKKNIVLLPDESYADFPALLDFLWDEKDRIEEELDRLKQEMHLLRRTQVKREALAAAYALIQMRDEKALSDLQGLLECEATGFSEGN